MATAPPQHSAAGPRKCSASSSHTALLSTKFASSARSSSPQRPALSCIARAWKRQFPSPGTSTTAKAQTAGAWHALSTQNAAQNPLARSRPCPSQRWERPRKWKPCQRPAGAADRMRAAERAADDPSCARKAGRRGKGESSRVLQTAVGCQPQVLSRGKAGDPPPSGSSPFKNLAAPFKK